MRVALIPPIDQLWHTHQTDLQLMLPQLLHDPEYRSVYERHLSNPNQYVIMDNGAAEDRQMSNEELVAIVDDLFPQELAIPDVLGEADATLAKAIMFLEDYSDYFEDSPTKLGYVTQGANYKEIIETVDYLMRSRWADSIEVFYVPRLLVPRFHDLRTRVKVANILAKYKRPIHLFGAAPTFLEEVRIAANTNIRSIDTSAPFVYATYNESITNMLPLNRPENYFDVVLDEEQRMIAADNVHTYLKWAGVRR